MRLRSRSIDRSGIRDGAVSIGHKILGGFSVADVLAGDRRNLGHVIIRETITETFLLAETA